MAFFKLTKSVEKVAEKAAGKMKLRRIKILLIDQLLEISLKVMRSYNMQTLKPMVLPQRDYRLRHLRIILLLQ